MKPPLCSLVAAAAVSFTLLPPPAVATRGLEVPPAVADRAGPARAGEVVLDRKLEPGRIEVALKGPGERPLTSEQATGKAVLTVNGRVLGVALLPAGGNRLVGQAPFRDGDEVSADVTVTVDGRVVTATYGVK